MNVITLGTFDLFHYGHVRLLQRCRALGDKLTVGLNTDEFVVRYRGRPPVLRYAERLTVIEACRYVDRVLPNFQEDGSARDVIELSGATVIAVGSDWQAKDYHGQIGVTAEWLAERGIRVVYLPYTESISSTAIRARLSRDA